MSTENNEEIFMFGDRLREERSRLGLSQAILGERLLTTGRTIAKYESNETEPRLRQLVLLGGLGADLNYILTGVKSKDAFIEQFGKSEFETEEEQILIDAFKKSDIEGKNLLLMLADYILKKSM